MLDNTRRFKAVILPLLLGLGAAGAAVGVGEAGSMAGPLSCEIRATADNGMISLEGVVHADAAVSGSYRFQVASAGLSGGTDIDQGGGFAAGPGDSVALGRVMVGGSGAAYDASLAVTADGVTVECAERVGGVI